MNSLSPLARSWVFAIAVIVFMGVGVWAIELQARQARDTMRKHDLEDLEHALIRHARAMGTVPPDNVPAWCGTLSASTHAPVRAVIEAALRRDEKYAKLEKPFPQDPRFGGTARDYFYWKTSPVSFELLAELEGDANDTRETAACGGTVAYDYGITSTERNSL